MVIGSVVVAVALLILGWTREISTFFFGEGDAVSCPIWPTILGIYSTDLFQRPILLLLFLQLWH
jgi:hypothetical protein